MKPELVELTNADPKFYRLIGPYLGRHAVHQALGGVPWDEDTKTWLVLTDKRGVVAFCAVNQERRRTLLESLYVARTDSRTAMRQLVAAATKRFGHDRDLHTVIRTEHTPVYQDCGFHPVKETTNFTTLVRPADIRKHP